MRSLVSLFAVLSFTVLSGTRLICQNENCETEFECLLVEKEWLDFGEFRLDSVCKKVVLDSCVWFQDTTFLIKNKGLYSFKTLDSTISLQFIIDSKMDDYGDFHKEITGKKYKGKNRVPRDSVYKHWILRLLNQQVDSSDIAFQKDFLDMPNMKSTTGFTLFEEFGVMKIHTKTYDAHKSGILDAYVKLNDDGAMIMLTLINWTSETHDYCRLWDVENMILNWFKLEDDFND